jgi:hypothetical protein
MNSISPGPSDLSEWIARIRGCDMPVFARTVDALRRIIGDERASASALAQVILKDASMTTKVLRLANSAYFNQAQQGVSTVSRAIVVLGFDPVAHWPCPWHSSMRCWAAACAAVSIWKWHGVFMQRYRPDG